MKLLRADKDHFTFRLGQREKRLLFQILQLYPLVPPSHHRLGRPREDPGQDEDQRLLEDALAEHRRENRRHILAMLNEPQRFQETPSGIRFTLALPQIEWLLQVLNDVRVGSWLALGEPKELEMPAVNQTNAPALLAMEAAGLFESVLLDGLGVENPKPHAED